jgi:MFS family permease
MRHATALAATCLAALMFGLEISSVPVVLPALGRELHADFVGMQWIMNAYTLACTTVLMAAGTLADRYGRRRIFVLAMIVFGIASLGCGIAQSATALVWYRALQGAGGGAMLTCLLAILSHQFREGGERSRAFGIWGIVFGAGLGLGPVAGGLIASLVDWRWVFLVHVPLTAVTLALVLATIRESRDPHAGRLDIAGIVLLSLAVLGLVSFIMEGPRMGFGHAMTMGIAAATLACIALFVIVERRSPEPLFDFSIFRIPRFSGAILGAAGMNVSFWRAP